MNTQELREAFQTSLEQADHTFFSPGRINLIGGTDYNGGHVFPAAITQAPTDGKREDKVLRFFSGNFEDKGDH